jgi:hypothetical protein
MGPIDSKEFDAALAPYAHLVEQPSPTSSGLSGGPASAFAGHEGVNEAVQAGIAHRPHYMALIAERCEQVKQSLAQGGTEDSRDLWYLGHITLTTGCVDGDAYAHRLGAQHPGYSEADTDSELQRAHDERARKALGLPTCAKYNDYRRNVCPGCPHWGHIRSPLSLGIENFDMPLGYRRNQGWLEAHIVDKNNEGWVPVVKSLVVAPRLIKLAEGYRLSFTHNAGHYVYFDEVSIPTEQHARQYFARQHITLHDHEAKTFGRFLVAWIKHLENMMQVHDDIKPCTWTKAGFAVGDILYQPDGSTRAIVCSDPIMAADFTPKGKREAWTQAVNTLIKDRPDIQIVVAAAFAAPLVQLGHFGGGLIASTYGPSGSAKSTAAAAGQSVWTSWHGNHIKLRDTVNAISDRLGRWGNIPQYLDEIRIYDDESSRRVIEMLFSISEGSDKLRLDRNATARKVNAWQSLCIITTNEVIMDDVISMTGGKTDAGALRLFSFPLETMYTGVTDTSLVKYFEGNRGSAGAVYAAWLAQNMDTAQSDYNVFARRLVDILQPQAGERFYIGFITCILLGAMYASALKLVDFDTAGMRDVLFANFNSLRQDRKDEIVTAQRADEVLDKFISSFQQEILVTDIMSSKLNVKHTPTAVRYPHTNAKRIEIHIALDDEVMRVNRYTMIEWCKKHHINWTVFRKDMEKQWRIDASKQAVIGKSNRTNPPGAYFTRCIEFDLRHPQLTHILDNVRKDNPLSSSMPSRDKHE